MSVRDDKVKEVIDLLQQAYNKYKELFDDEKEEVDKFLNALEEKN